MMRSLAALLLLLVPAAVVAHELRPGYLEIGEVTPGSYSVRFKVPARGELRLSLHPRFPDVCEDAVPARSESVGDAFVERRTLACDGGLVGRSVTVDGLAATFTDVVVRVSHADGAVQSARLTPDAPSFTVTGSASWTTTAATYFALGVEHILLGFDHLLFVLALMLLIREPWALVKTVTAFTVAHSITLAAAALEWSTVPQAPVEAVIALSIAFVAAEIVHQGRREPGLASRAPWMVAFAFGLLHGLGFGGALKAIGLPQVDVPLALLTFNLGVEAGQLLFIAAALAAWAGVRRLRALDVPRLRPAAGYLIGCIAATWFVERTVGMV